MDFTHLQFYLTILVAVLASIIAWRIIELARDASLRMDIVDASVPPSRAESPGTVPHQFFHVEVQMRTPWFPFGSRHPAWSVRATIDVLGADGMSQIIPETIEARWSSRPQPLNSVAVGTTLVDIFDVNGLILGRYHDVHDHETRAHRTLLDAIVKFEGQQECYIFSNESYRYGWKKPEWRLGAGSYILRYNLFYEGGRVRQDFVLVNSGESRDDVSISKRQSSWFGHNK